MLQLFKAKMLPKSLVEVRKNFLSWAVFLCAISTEAVSSMSQSELVTNTCSQHKARENVCEQVMIVWGLLNFWLVYNGRVFCSRLHSVLSVSIVYPPNWRIMCTSSFPRSTHCTVWLVWAHQSVTLPLRLGFEIVVSYAAVVCDVNQRSSPQERKRSDLVPRSLVDETDLVKQDIWVRD